MDVQVLLVFTKGHESDGDDDGEKETVGDKVGLFVGRLVGRLVVFLVGFLVWLLGSPLFLRFHESSRRFLATAPERWDLGRIHNGRPRDHSRNEGN